MRRLPKKAEGLPLHGFQQFLLGHHLAGMNKELQQDVQGLRFQLYRPALDPQLPSHFIKFVVGKTPQAAGSP